MRSLKVSLFLATRTIWRGNNWLNFVTVLMLMLVFLNLIFTPSLLEGVISTANSKLRDTLTSDITVESSEPGGLLSDAIQLASQISKIDGVSSSTPSRTISAQIELGSERGTVEVTGIETNSFSEVYTLPKFMLEGNFLKPGDRNQIVLGAQIAGADKAKLELYADSLKNAHAGDTVTLKFANGNKKDYTVKGIFQTDFIQTDLKTLITSDEYSEVLPATTNKASAINVKLKAGANQENVNNQIKQINSNITTRTWQERAGFVKSYTSSLELVNKILRAVALFVAFLTIFIITYVDIVNKKRQIGISRAIGISTTTIVMSYIIRAVFYTILGVVIGTLVFVLVIVPIEARFPFSFPLGDVLLSVNPAFIFRNAQILLLVSIVSALLPAFQAVRSKIVDAIWGQ
jgi:putative ABC transport system permease protein